MDNNIDSELDDIIKFLTTRISIATTAFMMSQKTQKEFERDVSISEKSARTDLKALIATSNVEARIDELKRWHNSGIEFDEIADDMIDDRIEALTHSKTTGGSE